jgi:hypothetical protein
LIAFGGITDRLIPLFAIGAFLAFTLSQAGMVMHWRRLGGQWIVPSHGHQWCRCGRDRDHADCCAGRKICRWRVDCRNSDSRLDLHHA